MRNSSIKLLIYDLDGTLIDSRRDIANSVNWALKELGFRALSTDQISLYVGSGVSHLIRSALETSSALGGDLREGQKLHERAVQLFRARYAEHLLEETKLYPSVRMVLERFRDFKQVVITNKPETFSRAILRGLGIELYFFRIIGGDQGFERKPSPQAVLEIVREAQVGVSEAALIGDSAIDIQTGKKAGVYTIAVTYGFGKRSEIEFEKPDYMFDDLKELLSCPLLSQN